MARGMTTTVRIIIAFLFCINVHAFKGLAQTRDTPDSLEQVTIDFVKRNSLVIVPVIINERVKVNLILDPYCQTVILFGKRYKKLVEKSKVKIRNRFLWRGKDIEPISFDNSISIGPVVGENVPILVVPNSNPINFFTSVNGVIGTHFFGEFDLIIHKRTQTITIKRAVKNSMAEVVRLNEGGNGYYSVEENND
jgi:hypothetical protein